MTASADTLYLPILAPAKIKVHDTGLQQQHRAPQSKPQQQHLRPRVYRIPSKSIPSIQAMKGMTYGPDGSVAVERTSGAQIDIFA